MRANSGYTPVESNAPMMGLATSPPSTRLDPAFSPNIMNCVVRDGVVSRRGGYQQIGRRLVGRVVAITEFNELNEDPYMVVLTTHRQYAYNPADDDFVDLTPGKVTYAITGATANTFVIAGNHAADFPAGRIFPVESGNNLGVYTTVSAVFGTSTTITVAETVPDTATPAGNIVIADDLDTGEFDIIDYIGITDLNGRRFLMTNGQDAPRVWNGDITQDFADWAPTYTDFVTCKTFAMFSEHLFLGGVETSVSEPQTIAWSTAGDFDDFETGTSGAQILYPLMTGIRAMRVLGDRLAVYSTDAVMTGTFVDVPAVFAFESVIPEGTRLATSRLITSINVGHIYWSDENLYLFDGTRGLRVLGNANYRDFKARKDHERLHLSATLNDYSKRSLYFSIPDLSGGFVIYTIEYDVFDLSHMIWSREKYADNPSAFGFFVNRTEVLLWEDASWEPVDMPWEDELGAWAEEAEQIRFPIRCFGSDEGRVFLVTEGVLTDNGVAVEQLYETADFTVPEQFHSTLARWGEVEFEGSGDEVEVSVSTDQGRNFTVLETVTLEGSPTIFQVPFDITSRTLRVRFKSELNFGLRWIRLWARPGAPR
jgi:hypothetical protein